MADRPDRGVRVATASISHTLCTAVFVSGLDPAQVYTEAVLPYPGMPLLDRGLRTEIDRERRHVRVSFAGAFANQSVYRAGLGCIVVHGAAPADTSLPPSMTIGRTSPVLTPESAGFRVVEPTDKKLRAALDRAFSEPEQPPPRWTKAVVIAHEGRVIAERYAPGYGAGTPLHGWSATKSVINALIGILVREGTLTVDQPAPVAAWRDPGDPRHAITIDHLLRMTSGLELGHSLSVNAKPGRDLALRMRLLERDMAGAAEQARLETAPGTTWNYANGNTFILSRIIRDKVGGRAADVLQFARRELFDPLGMRHVTLEFDATGTPVGAAYMYAPAREWARFGTLYLDDGVVDGRRILPQGWVHYSATPTPSAGIGYGAGFWTNRGTSRGATARVHWGMPPDSFFASGSLGQYVVVVPSERLVVARFGVSHGPRADIDGTARLVSDVIATLHVDTELALIRK